MGCPVLYIFYLLLALIFCHFSPFITKYCIGCKITLNIVFYNYIIKCLQFQAFQVKFLTRMFQIQLRYFQYILSFAIFVGVVISSQALITSCFVGLTLVWLTEMLVGQFDIKSQQYLVVLTVLLLSFSSVAIHLLKCFSQLVALMFTAFYNLLLVSKRYKYL